MIKRQQEQTPPYVGNRQADLFGALTKKKNNKQRNSGKAQEIDDGLNFPKIFHGLRKTDTLQTGFAVGPRSNSSISQNRPLRSLTFAIPCLISLLTTRNPRSSSSRAAWCSRNSGLATVESRQSALKRAIIHESRKNMAEISRFVFLIGVVVSLGACCDEQVSASQSRATYPPNPGIVRKVQIALQTRGYYAGVIDGFLGQNTAIGIERFQVDHDQRVNPLIDRSLLVSLAVKNN